MKTYLVKEIFDSLQGEGARAGSRSVFVRMALCNLWNGRAEDRDKGRGLCAEWCDTDFLGGDRMDVRAIVGRVRALWPAGPIPGDRWVVLTGGEPALQVDDTLLHTLKVEGFRVAIETNGTIRLPFAGLDWICVSPKLGGDNLKVTRGAEMKVILPGTASGSGWPAARLLELEEDTDFDHYFVQPQDGPNDGRNIEHQLRCVGFVKANPTWRLSVQTHKLMGLP